MTECKNIFEILEELKEDAKQIDDDKLKEVEKLITEANRIFISGAGRSGFAARGFSNRLMHLGYTVYFVGEPTTPSIQEGDLLIVGSGSGNTASLVSNTKKAKSGDSYHVPGEYDWLHGGCGNPDSRSNGKSRRERPGQRPGGRIFFRGIMLDYI